MPRWADHLIQVSDILLSEQASGEVRVNLGDLTTGVGVAAESPVWGVDGFVSMPNAPDAAGCCQAVWFVDGNQKNVIASRDNRWAEKAGNLAPGDRAIVSNCDARVILRQAKNQILAYTVNEQDGDSSMLIELNGAEGFFQVVVGASFIKLTKDKLQINVDGSMLEIDADQFAVFAKHFSCNVGGGHFGLVAGAPPPPGAMSVTVGAVGQAAVGSSKFTMAL